MPGRRRGARTGRGWDAAPPRPRRPTKASTATRAEPTGPDEPESDPAERAREICLRLLAVRPRTHAELATALRKRGIDAEVASSVLDRYRDVGIIDDAAFARAWVSSRHHGRGLARRALGNELRQRGVDRELVGEALGEVDDETEAATARALVERKV
ncbi:MAG: regulatory protein RecX, partial [Micromonosporaceae bacterium]|nr:regulatory protein RecX [Micromonosporaceae bacterium]